MIIDEGCCYEELLVRRPSSGCRGCICCLYDGYEQRIFIASYRCVSLSSLSFFPKPNAPFNDFIVIFVLIDYDYAGFSVFDLCSSKSEKILGLILRINSSNICWYCLFTGFVKAMSNTYGILLITVLMGNGLVGLPRRLWHWADTERELNSLYMTVIRRTIDVDECLWFERLLNFMSPWCGRSCDRTEYDVMRCCVMLCYTISYFVLFYDAVWCEW